MTATVAVHVRRPDHRRPPMAMVSPGRSALFAQDTSSHARNQQRENQHLLQHRSLLLGPRMRRAILQDQGSVLCTSSIRKGDTLPRSPRETRPGGGPRGGWGGRPQETGREIYGAESVDRRWGGRFSVREARGAENSVLYALSFRWSVAIPIPRAVEACFRFPPLASRMARM